MTLPKALGPDVDENASLKTQVLKAPKQPSEQERIAHSATHLPFRSWCPERVQGQRRERPREKVEVKEGTVPHVEMNLFFVGSDELAARYATKDNMFMKEKSSRRSRTIAARSLRQRSACWAGIPWHRPRLLATRRLTNSR